MSLKEAWKKLWFLIWKDNSLKGWIFSIIFIFLFIKFIFFPALSLATGTPLPLAIVESCSMYHKGNIFSDFDSWFERHEEKYSEFEIDDSKFLGFPMKSGFNKGDILFVIGTNSEKLKEGDIIIFGSNQRNPIIHRIVDIKEANGIKVFSTIGDNNGGQLEFEKEITEDQIIGKASLKIAPYLGWVKLIFYEWQKSESERGSCNER